MKLLSKTSIYYLLFALPVFAICSVLLYYLVSGQITDNVDESLVKEKIKVEEKLKTTTNINDLDNAISLTPIKLNSADKLVYKQEHVFSDTTMYDSIEEEILPYRVLTAIVKNDSTSFKLIIRKSSMESDDLIESIIYPVLILFVILLVGFFIINWLVSKKIWTPFYYTVERLNKYKIDETPTEYESTSIKEFSELNAVLTAMTQKIYSDYKSQKQFIENASHEIQTPLAVIKSKIEILIQSSTLSESDMQIIQSLYNASNKLSLLNKGLLLLSKIENNQFIDLENIQFKQLIEKNLEHFEDLISIKNLKIERNYQSNPFHQMNPVLADILITNLIQNAIRHNIKDGFIKIELTENSVKLSNSGGSTVANTNELFDRFKKSDGSVDSIGLGLAIVKEICENFDMTIKYTCENFVHTIELFL
jgi:signal transduction histidine kinase